MRLKEYLKVALNGASRAFLSATFDCRLHSRIGSNWCIKSSNLYEGARIFLSHHIRTKFGEARLLNKYELLRTQDVKSSPPHHSYPSFLLVTINGSKSTLDLFIS
jgi:hypothetical protein